MSKRSATCLTLTAIAWVAICAALLDAGLARHFDPEQYCDNTAAIAAVCR
jgi:hypothetical protein